MGWSQLWCPLWKLRSASVSLLPPLSKYAYPLLYGSIWLIDFVHSQHCIVPLSLTIINLASYTPSDWVHVILQFAVCIHPFYCCTNCRLGHLFLRSSCMPQQYHFQTVSPDVVRFGCSQSSACSNFSLHCSAHFDQTATGYIRVTAQSAGYTHHSLQIWAVRTSGLTTYLGTHPFGYTPVLCDAPPAANFASCWPQPNECWCMQECRGDSGVCSVGDCSSSSGQQQLYYTSAAATVCS